MRKNIIAAALAACLCLSISPVPAMAAEEPKTDIHVKTVFDDQNNQDGVRFGKAEIQLTKDKKAEGNKVTLDEKNHFSYDFTNLPVNNSKGSTVDYEIEEDAIPGYEMTSSKEVSLSKDTDGNVKREETITLTHKHVPKTISVTCEARGVPGAVINLLADGEKTASQKTGADGRVTFQNLPKYQKGKVKKEVEYTVTEDPITGYVSETVGSVEEGFVIKNYASEGATSLFVSMAFHDDDDHDGKRPDNVNVQVYKDGQPYGDPLPLNAKNAWMVTVNSLPVGNNWTVRGVDEAGYTAETKDTTVIFSHPNEKVKTSGKILWNDHNNNDASRPENVKVSLYRGNEKIAEKTVSGKDNWAYDFGDQDKYINKKEVLYSVKADPVNDYTTEQNGFDFTETHTPDLMTVSGKIAWKGDKEEDRPESLKLTLYNGNHKVKDFTVSRNEGWEYELQKLLKMPDGKREQYQITAEGIKGYDVSVEKYNVTYTKEKAKKGTPVKGERVTIEPTETTAVKTARSMNWTACVMTSAAVVFAAGILIIYHKKKKK